MARSIRPLLRGMAVALGLALACFPCFAKGSSEKTADRAAGTSTGRYPDKLKVFGVLSEHVSKVGATSNNDLYVYKEVEKITGTKVTWIHPAVGADIDMAINLMVASKDLPDLIVKAKWKDASGGVASWVTDGTLCDLTKRIPESMPAYWKTVQGIPGAINDLYVDGKLYYVAEIGHGSAYRGPVLRGDWLRKLNQKFPTTVGELYDVLTAIRKGDPNGNGKADEWPMSDLAFQDQNFGLGHLLWPFGVHWGFLQVDGKVTFGPLQPEFAEAMAYIRKLYAEGLIDPDYATQDRNSLDGKFMNHLVGYEYGMQPTKMNGALNGAGGFAAEGTLNMKRDAAGPAYVFGSEYIAYISSNSDTAVTTKCREPGKALSWIDFFFTDEGVKLGNWGIEGLSHKMVDGKPVYDFTGALALRKDLDANSVKYMFLLMSLSTFPTRQTLPAYYATLHPLSATAIDGWNKVADKSRILPNVSLSQKERESINDRLVDINTYIAIQYDKLVTGQTPIAEIPAIQKRLVDMGINDCIKVYQAAYDRYLRK